jgi:uncharacterized protein YndB with AHSA1/START domain
MPSVTSRAAQKENLMDRPELVFVTYIAATPEKVWQALVDPPVTAKYWGYVNVSDWKPGSRWEHHEGDPGGKLMLVGTVVEVDAPRRLVLTWAEPADEGRPGKHTRVTFTLEKVGTVVKLTVVHDRFEPGSDMATKVSEGWPKVLSSLKSLMESGRPLPALW